MKLAPRLDKTIPQSTHKTVGHQGNLRSAPEGKRPPAEQAPIQLRTQERQLNEPSGVSVLRRIECIPEAKQLGRMVQFSCSCPY